MEFLPGILLILVHRNKGKKNRKTKGNEQRKRSSIYTQYDFSMYIRTNVLLDRYGDCVCVCISKMYMYKDNFT